MSRPSALINYITKHYSNRGFQRVSDRYDDKCLLKRELEKFIKLLSSVANLITEESEEREVEDQPWLDWSMIVDLFSCFAILLPVFWSIRRLQKTYHNLMCHTDRKAAMMSHKLKLLRYFLGIIFCYIYCTRIVVYLLKMTVLFQYGWVDEMVKEIVTYIFFVTTGYMFRPASATYLHLSTDEEDETN